VNAPLCPYFEHKYPCDREACVGGRCVRIQLAPSAPVALLMERITTLETQIAAYRAALGLVNQEEPEPGPDYRGALAPFAKLADALTPEMPDDYLIISWEAGAICVTVGDVRRAHALVEGGPQ
jgi:hypothetical protein